MKPALALAATGLTMKTGDGILLRLLT